MKPLTHILPTGVIVERREIDNPWQDHTWRPIAVIPGASPVAEWRLLHRGENWVHYHAATLDLELHRKETDGYLVNLAQTPPMVFVVLRPGEEEGDHEYEPFLVTVCPDEAHDYVESGEEIVEGVPMPPRQRSRRRHRSRKRRRRRRQRLGQVRGQGGRWSAYSAAAWDAAFSTRTPRNLNSTILP